MDSKSKNKGIENLKPIKKGELSSEEAARRGRKGGLKSAENKRQRKAFKEIAEKLLSMNLNGGEVIDYDNLRSASGKNMTIEEAIILKQVRNALKGNLASTEFLRDTVGERPVLKQEVNTTFDTGKLDDIFDQLTDEEKEKEK